MAKPQGDFFIDLYSMEGGKSSAARALAGEPILILPKGTFYRNGRAYEVNDETIKEFLDNYANRLNRGIRRDRLAVDIDHEGGAVGWYKDLLELPNGLGATFGWTKKGRAALEEDEFAYFSPSIYWEQTDQVTNQKVRNQVGGGALTNYPFFGEITALYSAGGGILYLGDGDGGSMGNGTNGGGQGGGDQPLTMEGFRAFFAELFGGLRSMQPAGQQAPDMSEFNQKFAQFTSEMATMKTQLQEANAKLTAKTAESDQYKAQLEGAAGRISVIEQERQLERFTMMAAAKFSHMPGESGQLAQQLRWLYSMDQEKDQSHAQFFSQLLEKADTVLAEAFSARGSGATRIGSGKTMEKINVEVAKYRAAHTEADYTQALSEVFAQNPDLYREYELEQDESQKGGR